MEIIRNLTRRKLRNILTISGIVIGVLALVTMGAMAEKFNALLSGGATYFGSNVQVADSSSGAVGGFGGGLLTLDRVSALEKVDGVAAAFPDVSVSAKPGSANAVSFGIPDYISNLDPRSNDYSAFKIHIAQGRDLNTNTNGEVVLGSDFATEFKKNVGNTIDLPVKAKDAPPDFINHTFTVVGILAKTQTAPDTGAYVSLADSQMLLKETLPASIAALGRLKVGDEFVHESIIGSLFEGRVEAAARVGNHDAIVPSISGWARQHGINTIFVDERDPFAHGFQV